MPVAMPAWSTKASRHGHELPAASSRPGAITRRVARAAPTTVPSGTSEVRASTRPKREERGHRAADDDHDCATSSSRSGTVDPEQRADQAQQRGAEVVVAQDRDAQDAAGRGLRSWAAARRRVDQHVEGRRDGGRVEQRDRQRPPRRAPRRPPAARASPCWARSPRAGTRRARRESSKRWRAYSSTPITVTVSVAKAASIAGPTSPTGACATSTGKNGRLSSRSRARCGGPAAGRRGRARTRHRPARRTISRGMTTPVTPPPSSPRGLPRRPRSCHHARHGRRTSLTTADRRPATRFASHVGRDDSRLDEPAGSPGRRNCAPTHCVSVGTSAASS